MNDETTVVVDAADESAVAIARLSKDLKHAALTMSANEARFLVDSYYTMQENRIRADGQIRSMTPTGEPHAVLAWFAANAQMLEEQVRAALNVYSRTTEVGKWSRSVKGIGPVLAAGLMANIDVEKAPTVGHIWSFAGLNPTSKWEKGQKRPWNASLKVLCWKIGESFVKVSSRDGAFYGKCYADRKSAEIAGNDSGKFAEQARAKAQLVGKTTDAWAWNSGCYPAGANGTVAALADVKAREKWLETNKGEPGSGVPMLAPAHIHARSKRYAVKLFLAHWHEVAYKAKFGKAPPLPYPVAMLGHAHVIPPPQPGDDQD